MKIIEEKTIRTQTGLEVLIRFARKGKRFWFEACKQRTVLLALKAKIVKKTAFLFPAGLLRVAVGFRGKGVTQALVMQAVLFLKKRFPRVVLPNLADEKTARHLASGGRVQSYYEFALGSTPQRYQIVW